MAPTHPTVYRNGSDVSVKHNDVTEMVSQLMKSYCEIEIVVQQDVHGTLQAHARQRLEQQDLISQFVAVELDVNASIFHSGDARQIGNVLSTALLHPPAIRDALVSAKAFAATYKTPLRVRLRIDPATSPLHHLPWETLADPSKPDQFLFDNVRCIFSRYLFTRELRLPLLRAKQDMKALVAIANPQDLVGALTFTSEDIERQLAIARKALLPLPARVLAGPGSVTLTALMEALQEEVDILFLACHGVTGHMGNALWLEDGVGNGQLVTADFFAAQIGQLRRPPSLIILCSCQSAGNGTAERNELCALGPRLAMQGVPAVLAMQGLFSFASAEAYLPVFFKELAKHGEVDLAAASARSAIFQQHDWWMPVVFTRLDSARIWYPPGFDQTEGETDVWKVIVTNVRGRTCTPILGPAFSETLSGPRRALANDWVDIYRYPMSGRDVEDFPQVAQYLSTTRGELFLRRAFYRGLYNSLFERLGNLIPEDMREYDDDTLMQKLNYLLSVVGAKMRKSDTKDPHALLASHRLPVYITADPSNLLCDALTETGTVPRTRLLRWNTVASYRDMHLIEQASVPASKTPSADEPIIVKLFGDLDEPGSLVLTEDNYFEYLAKASSAHDAMPPSVRCRVIDSPLLFAGFQPDAWEFRVLLRSLLQMEGRDLLLKHNHFSVQMDPNSILDPGSARRYIDQYLNSKVKLQMYWGDVQAFVNELDARVNVKEHP
ncbi:hypothetical protein DMX08_29105 [Pseudomonas protegens]|uniref:CHAT domain-containing protein n=2 Tax=Pseudomonas protegens TaxID=380021 RepID=A0A9Q6IA04_9PSED|nr:hypothetical protein DMX08_29105 [Pseudomonas protegens]